MNLEEARPTTTDFERALSYIHRAEGPFDRLYLLDAGIEHRDHDPIVLFGDPTRSRDPVVYEIYGDGASDTDRECRNVKVGVEGIDLPGTEALPLGTFGSVRLYDVPSATRRTYRDRCEAYGGRYDPEDRRLAHLVEYIRDVDRH